MVTLNPKKLLNSFSDKVDVADALARSQLRILHLDECVKALKALDIIYSQEQGDPALRIRTKLEEKLISAIHEIADIGTKDNGEKND